MMKQNWIMVNENHDKAHNKARKRKASTNREYTINDHVGVVLAVGR